MDMSLEIVKAGLLSTFQDAGRVGYGAQGIHPTGAMDPEALYLANALVGNPDTMAAIEMHFPIGVLCFREDALIALTGANCQPMLNGETLSMNEPVFVKAGSILTGARPIDGARSYLAIAGGWNLPFWLGSASTDRSAQAGGWEGRALKKGEVIPYRKRFQFHHGASIPESLKISNAVTEETNLINLIAGPEYRQLDNTASDLLVGQAYTISSQSDRMGIRLRGELPIRFESQPLISCSAFMGTMQLLPNGELILLMADHPTTGGYPRIAHLPYFEWSRLAQARPGVFIRFSWIELVEAQARNEQWIRAGMLQRDRIRSVVQSYLQQHATEC
jgi:antagonist of KipI